jgi:hypothetical protein
LRRAGARGRGAKFRAKKRSVSIPCRLAAFPVQGIVLRAGFAAVAGPQMHDRQSQLVDRIGAGFVQTAHYIDAGLP